MEAQPYQLLPEHIEFRKVVREFVMDKVAPRAAEIDATGEYPHDLHAEFVKADLLSVLFPEEHGGAGADAISQAILVEEVARICASTSMIPILSKLGTLPILLAGTDDQKDQWFPKVITGEAQAAYALTEAEAGSDPASMRTRAVRDGDEYVLNGSKRFISNAGVATVYTVLAKTDAEAGARGVTCFIVPADTAGFEVVGYEDKMGLKGSPTGELSFDDARIPVANRVGEEGEGFAIAMRTLDFSRPGVAAQALGIAQGAFDAAVEYAKQRQQFGKPIIQHQAVAFMLADMKMKTDAARHLVYDAHAALDRNDADLTTAAAVAKCFASDVAMEVTTDAVQVFGGYGYIKDFPVERYMRDAKITQLYEGTNQIQRLVISRRLAGR